MPFCPDCHAEVTDTARFCDNCGYPLSAPPSRVPAPVQTPAAAARPSLPAAAPPAAAHPPSAFACPACGIENVAGEIFCQNCGETLPPLSSRLPSAAPLNPPPAHSTAAPATLPWPSAPEATISTPPAAPLGPTPTPPAPPIPPASVPPSPRNLPAANLASAPPAAPLDPTPTPPAPPMPPASVPPSPSNLPAANLAPAPPGAPLGPTPTPPNDAPPYQTAALNPLPPDEADIRPALIAPPPSPGRLVLRATGQAIPLPAGSSEVLIGRSDPIKGVYPHIDLSPFGGDNSGVSRRHARLLFVAGSVTVEDLHSTNFTFINRQKLEPGRPYPLHPGDELRLGLMALIYQAGG